MDGNAGRPPYSYLPSSQITLRADLTYFKDGLAGSHEFQTGFFGAPRSTYDTKRSTSTTDSSWRNGARWTRRIRRRARFRSTGGMPRRLELTIRQARDRNFAVYVQDNWKPTPRLTANLGVRFDWVRRYDKIFDVVRENATSSSRALGLLVPRDEEREERAARQLRPPGRADDGT